MLSQLEITTFDEFIAWYPENSEYRYELHDGVIVQMPKPTGSHTKVASFIRSKLDREIERLDHPYFIPRECIVKPNDKSGYEPDVIVLNEATLQQDQRWEVTVQGGIKKTSNMKSHVISTKTSLDWIYTG